jgi:hypothetical protein
MLMYTDMLILRELKNGKGGGTCLIGMVQTPLVAVKPSLLTAPDYMGFGVLTRSKCHVKKWRDNKYPGKDPTLVSLKSTQLGTGALQIC